jgi:hypothetical protein
VGASRLKCDVDSYNDNNPSEQPIQMVLDFTEDMMELEAGSEWSAA